MDGLTTTEVAQLLGVSDETVRRYIKEGKLPGYQLTEDSWYRVDRKQLEQYAKERNLRLDWSVLDK